MANIIVLKKNGEIKTHPIKEDILRIWEILMGLGFPDGASEQIDIELQRMANSNFRRNNYNDWAVFTKIDGKKLVINKRFIAWVEE